jgi:large subunit ribosomal protein L1
MTGKRYNASVADRPAGVVSLRDAVGFVKGHAKAKFDETVDVHLRLGVDPKQSDQGVRGTVTLPHGSPSSVRVAVFAEASSEQDAARAAGAEIVGGRELIDTVRTTGQLDADAAVTTPAMMKDLAGIAKILGPRGLMPNPKTGTIGPDPAVIVKQLKGGKVNFKMDDSGNLHLSIAKASWEADKIAENIRAVLEAVRQARPTTAKGEFLKSVTLAATMGPSISFRP